ncbi:hypothetical protein H112_03210 [Trichophyton rubrum D6]|uniref:Uncharacterized protein n=3 Tax=Trichophyton TaxID=5550 RepID=A0A080WVE5_TRIRC|nr:uncharacterized protein TERG_12340 [Trichophyton rubrum CBS 118892]EZF24353.1 hypothetical protein H100_03214 [Trichophyton rubrum MR850]EZF43314.1 hypothetical protein H102_03208 [Trichophyton rubrum CBS 100081]EZF53956.1 hypothetical protein H103_03222 [Trichophyton rubrum CBS 288.86]EZF64539.1 hypothetical protein H104_03204 [Trichophyton rubrum CBS 289.86]EZF75186.1 hypothetical protein H105_03226 [Trichophyton soudanense CBS 452.61]EZF85883.1 hypothetical protein H110_03215 [Trichophy
MLDATLQTSLWSSSPVVSAAAHRGGCAAGAKIAALEGPGHLRMHRGAPCIRVTGAHLRTRKTTQAAPQLRHSSQVLCRFSYICAAPVSPCHFFHLNPDHRSHHQHQPPMHSYSPIAVSLP